MSMNRRNFLYLSALGCAWLLTGCKTEERAIPLPQTAAGSQPQDTSTDGSTTPSDTGSLREGIVIPDGFELPLEGATGIIGASVLQLYAEPSEEATVLRLLAAGDMFYIRQESGAYWQVCILDGTIGWVQSCHCMINLPDVLPSVVYDNPNAVSSIFRTRGQDIRGITGQKLYDDLFYNPRLGRDEFVMPINYAMAKKVGIAQRTALQAGDCLKIVETFRPYEVQMEVKDAVYAMARADSSLMAALNAGSWSIGWFIATSLSNHQRGVAMDTSLLRVTSSTEHSLGGCSFVRVEGEEYQMPSAMHELSSAAACFTRPVNSASKTAWLSATPAQTMTEGAKRLQSYCTSAGLTPLASEWWHFNDIDAQNVVRELSGNGQFWLDGCVSWKMFEA